MAKVTVATTNDATMPNAESHRGMSPDLKSR
jgi:hypothetical protein